MKVDTREQSEANKSWTNSDVCTIKRLAVGRKICILKSQEHTKRPS